MATTIHIAVTPETDKKTKRAVKVAGEKFIKELQGIGEQAGYYSFGIKITIDYLKEDEKFKP